MLESYKTYGPVKMKNNLNLLIMAECRYKNILLTSAMEPYTCVKKLKAELYTAIELRVQNKSIFSDNI